MKRISHLTHVTDSHGLFKIMQSGFIEPQSKTNKEGRTIPKTDLSKVFFSIAFKDDPNHGIHQQNIHDEDNNILINFNKKILNDFTFWINPGWYGYPIDEEFHSTKNKKFKNMIDLIENKESFLKLPEIMIEASIDIEEYVDSIYFIFGTGFYCDVDYSKIILPLSEFLHDTDSDILNSLIGEYTHYHRIFHYLDIDYSDIKIYIVELNNSCSKYNIRKMIERI